MKLFTVTSPDGKHTNSVFESDAEQFRAKGWEVEEAPATPKKPQARKTQAPKKTTTPKK